MSLMNNRGPQCYIEMDTFSLNTSYMASVRMLSSMALRPLAPVFLAIAFWAIILSAFSV